MSTRGQEPAGSGKDSAVRQTTSRRHEDAGPHYFQLLGSDFAFSYAPGLRGAMARSVEGGTSPLARM